MRKKTKRGKNRKELYLKQGMPFIKERDETQELEDLQMLRKLSIPQESGEEEEHVLV